MTQNATLLLPVKGIDLKSPLANMDPITSPFIANIDTDGSRLSLRPSIRQHSTGLLAGVLSLGEITFSLSQKLYAWAQGGGSGGIYDITVSGVNTLVDSPSNVPDEIFSNYYNKRLWFGTEIAATQLVYDGASWAAAAWQFRGLIGYKSRAYFFTGDSSIYSYSLTVGGIAGTKVDVDLSSIFKKPGGIAWITSFSQSDGITNEIYLAIGDVNGEVLIYAGDYPGADNWRILSKFDIGLPVGFQQVIEYQNDRLIITAAGLVSLRNLFINGVNAAFSENISEPIDAYWSALVRAQNINIRAAPSYQWSGVFWKEQNKIVIMTQGSFDENNVYYAGAATFFVLDCTSQAWTFWTWDTGLDPVYYKVNNLISFNKDLYFAINDKVMRISYNFSSLLDTSADNLDQSIVYSILGPHQSAISDAVNKKVEGFELLLKCSSSAIVQMQCTSDFGRRVSNLMRPSIPLVTNNYYKLKFSVGAEGSFYQYKIYGQTTGSESIRPEFYSITTLFNSGGNR